MILHRNTTQEKTVNSGLYGYFKWYTGTTMIDIVASALEACAKYLRENWGTDCIKYVIFTCTPFAHELYRNDSSSTSVSDFMM